MCIYIHCICHSSCIYGTHIFSANLYTNTNMPYVTYIFVHISMYASKHLKGLRNRNKHRNKHTPSVY